MMMVIQYRRGYFQIKRSVFIDVEVPDVYRKMEINEEERSVEWDPQTALQR